MIDPPTPRKLSLCMIVRNEERWLPGCLKSIDGVVDEVVVVDTGSTDLSVEIATHFGARVIPHMWIDDFSDARNVSLEAATGDWIMVLDADEKLSAQSKTNIHEVISADEVDGVEMIIRSELPSTDVAAYEETRIIRLFRNRREYRYQMPIHEQIRPAIEEKKGKIVASDLTIIHHGYAHISVQQGSIRADRNLRILFKALESSPRDPYIHYQLGSTLMSIGRRQEAMLEFEKALSLDTEKLGAVVLDKLYLKMSQIFLERNEYCRAVEFAKESLKCNPLNAISGYVAAIACLSTNRIAEGYGYLIRVRDNPKDSLRLRSQLSELIAACEKVLGGPNS